MAEDAVGLAHEQFVGGMIVLMDFPPDESSHLSQFQQRWVVLTIQDAAKLHSDVMLILLLLLVAVEPEIG